MRPAGAHARHGAQVRSRVVATALLTLFLLYTLLPIFYLVVSSTKNNAQLFSSFGLWFSGFHLFANLRELFTYGGGVYSLWLWNTAYYSALSAIGASLLASAAGYAFAKYDFAGRHFLFALVLGAVMVPQTALVIPLFLLLSKAGIVDTPLAFILPSLISPLGVYLMRVYTEQSISDELLDAARIDGASEFRIFASIVFRLLAPAFVTVLLLAFVATWNNYFLPLVMFSTPRYFPLTVGLAAWYQQASAGSGAQALFSLVMTGALVAIIPIIIAFLFLQRFWQGGLSVGSIK